MSSRIVNKNKSIENSINQRYRDTGKNISKRQEKLLKDKLRSKLIERSRKKNKRDRFKFTPHVEVYPSNAVYVDGEIVMDGNKIVVA